MIDKEILIDKSRRTLGLYDDLIAILENEHLMLDLPGLPSNTIGQQLWCVVGARQSYTRAIIEGGWKGFSCSLSGDQIGVKIEVRNQLEKSKAAFLEFMNSADSLSPAQQSLLIDLLEHEAQHHGQLIRYLFALKIPIPAAWKTRYNLQAGSMLCIRGVP